MTVSVPLSIAPREDQLWPTLTPVQIARIEKQGRRRSVRAGDVLMEAGQEDFSCFVVLDGELEVVRPSCDGDQLITTYRQGSFSGEINMLAGRRPVASVRATKAGEVIEVQRERCSGSCRRTSS